MVDETFCRVCACALSPAEDVSASEESGTNYYSNHCRTENHIRNSTIYERFNSEEKDYYNPMKEALRELLSKGVALYQELKDGQLQSKIGEFEKELKESDIEITKIRDSAEWREGVTLLQGNLSGKMGMLRMKLERTIEECEKKRVDLERAREQEARKGEEESNEVYESDEEEEIEQANCGEKIRKKKRQKAKGRRGKK